MSRIILSILLFSISAMWAWAAEPVDSAAGSFDLAKAQEELEQAAKAARVTEEEVGDVGSFGRKVTYLGVASTEPVVLQADCSGFDPESGVCIETSAAPAATPVDEPELAVIELPARASRSILCFTVTQFKTWLWNNTTAAQAVGDMSLYVTVQIESDALMGLNDSDGNPFNGMLFPIPNPIIVSTHQHTLPPGAAEIQRERSSRSCTGGFVSARSLEAEGLTRSQIRRFFRRPMTVTFGVQGSATLVDFATFFAGVRLYGD